MRTTIVLDDALMTPLKRLVPARKLSEFINHCVREYLERRTKAEQLKKLEHAYQRAAGKKPRSDFDISDVEDWPAW